MVKKKQLKEIAKRKSLEMTETEVKARWNEDIGNYRDENRKLSKINAFIKQRYLDLIDSYNMGGCPKQSRRTAYEQACRERVESQARLYALQTKMEFSRLLMKEKGIPVEQAGEPC